MPAHSISPQLSLDAQCIWCDLAASGQWFTLKGLEQHWQNTYAPHELDDATTALVNRGHLIRRNQGLQANTYGVTSDCRPIPGFDLQGRRISHQEGNHA